MAEEQELTKQKKRKAQVQFETQFYTEEDWDTIRAKLEANVELKESVIGEDLTVKDFAKRMVELVNQRRKHFVEERARAKRNKPMTQTQLRNYMSNFLKNQGIWKLTQLKKMTFEEVKEEFEKLVKQLDTFVRAQPTEEKINEAKDDEPTKKTGKRRKQIARKGFHTEKTDEDESDKEEETTKPPSIASYKIIKQGRKGVYQIVKGDGTYMVYISFGAMLKDISRDDLTELYRIVIKKHGMDEPEDEFEKVLWEYLKNMFEEPFSTDLILSLPESPFDLEPFSDRIKVGSNLEPKSTTAAAILTKVQKIKSVDKGKRYKRRKRSKEFDGTGLDFEEVKSAFEKVNTGGIKVSSGNEEKDKEQIFQEESLLAEAIRLDALEKALKKGRSGQTSSFGFHFIAQRMAEEQELTEEQIEGESALDRILKLTNMSKKDGDSGTICQNLSKESIGTWKLTQLKKLNFEEVKAEFENLVKQLDTYVPMNFEATKESLKRFGEELQTKTAKKLKFDDEGTQPTEEKIEEDERISQPKDWKEEKTYSKQYRIVMKKHGMNEPEDEFEKVPGEYLKNMFEEPLSTYSIWSLPGQQRIICWRYYDACRNFKEEKPDEHCYKHFKIWRSKLEASTEDNQRNLKFTSEDQVRGGILRNYCKQT
ncbi:hypothetical protein Tco_0789300 [Tanacetum coccineum]